MTRTTLRAWLAAAASGLLAGTLLWMAVALVATGQELELTGDHACIEVADADDATHAVGERHFACDMAIPGVEIVLYETEVGTGDEAVPATYLLWVVHPESFEAPEPEEPGPSPTPEIGVPGIGGA